MVGVGIGCCSSLSVCPERNSKKNECVQTWCIGNDLGHWGILEMTRFWGFKIRRGFEFYECLLVILVQKTCHC